MPVENTQKTKRGRKTATKKTTTKTKTLRRKVPIKREGKKLKASRFEYFITGLALGFGLRSLSDILSDGDKAISTIDFDGDGQILGDMLGFKGHE
jgi:hypothetical protein